MLQHSSWNVGSRSSDRSRPGAEGDGQLGRHPARARRQHVDPARQEHRLLHVVGDHEDGGAGVAPHLEHELLHRRPGLGVEGAERLVEEQHRRLGGQGPGDRHPLLHPARQLPGQRAGEVGQAHDVQVLGRPGRAISASARPFSSRPKATFSATVRHG